MGNRQQEYTLNDEDNYFSRDPDWEAQRVESGLCPPPSGRDETSWGTWWAGQVSLV